VSLTASSPDIRSFTREELGARLQSGGLPAYRLDQLLQWLYPARVAAWDEMTNLPRVLREDLAREFGLRLPDLVEVQGSPDSTRKFLWRLADRALIESVLIPASPALYGESSDRHTLCVSTQVGCAYGCRFCASGLEGWKRHLTADEIVTQVVAVERWHARESRVTAADAPQPAVNRLINNLVIMGMGEPLANYENLLRALTILNAPWGGGVGARKITVSTSGLVPQIRALADQPLQFGLAVSLHGATDAVRDRIMPVNRKYPLRELVAVCEYFVKRKGRIMTLEYILIAGVNDQPEHARALVPVARRLHAKVNLIPYNQVEGLPWSRPADEDQQRFLHVLECARVPVTLRIEKGHAIDAACGQLRLRTERRQGQTPTPTPSPSTTLSDPAV
jgi:23S rRNA (adenine2503-C2)-methyltransferase